MPEDAFDLYSGRIVQVDTKEEEEKRKMMTLALKRFEISTFHIGDHIFIPLRLTGTLPWKRK